MSTRPQEQRKAPSAVAGLHHAVTLEPNTRSDSRLARSERSIEDLTRSFLGLFAGRSDVYGISGRGNPDGSTPIPDSDDPFVWDSHDMRPNGNDWSVVESLPDVKIPVIDHFVGNHLLGIVPLRKDGTTRLFMLPIDGQRYNSWFLAYRQWQILTTEARLPVYVTRAHSIDGYCVWGFLEHGVDAEELGAVLLPYVEMQSTADRMFPGPHERESYGEPGRVIPVLLFGPGVSRGTGAFVQPSSRDCRAAYLAAEPPKRRPRWKRPLPPRRPIDSPEQIADQRGHVVSIRRIRVDRIADLGKGLAAKAEKVSF